MSSEVNECSFIRADGFPNCTLLKKKCFVSDITFHFVLNPTAIFLFLVTVLVFRTVLKSVRSVPIILCLVMLI